MIFSPQEAGVVPVEETFTASSGMHCDLSINNQIEKLS